MSTGAECRFVQVGRVWYYKIQDYPYGATESYTKEGPFQSFRAAKDHLNKNHANPGGYSIEHDKYNPCEHPTCMNEWLMDGSVQCNWCGCEIKPPKPVPKANKVIVGTQIKLRMGKKTTKAVDDMEIYVISDRFDGELNIRLTDEGIIADLVVNGEVIKTMSIMYDELIESWLQ